MKKLLPLLSVLFLIYWGCEEQQDEGQDDDIIIEDTTPPTVSVSSHYSSQIVYEIVSIVVLTQDNVGIEKVEFFINDSLVFSDFDSPYQYVWDTTPLEEESENIIKVISYDVSGNSTQSQPIMLLVKNEIGKPSSSDINSIIFQNGSFTINWNSSNSDDFLSYQLEKSTDSLNNNFQLIHSTQDIMDTTYIDYNVNPLEYYYYRVITTDTLGLISMGEIFNSSLDEVPNSIDVMSVEYTFNEMTISWEESVDGDFKLYNLLSSDTEDGFRDTLITILDRQTTSHDIFEFNPLQENWFWIEVLDTLNQSSVGVGLTNDIETPPSPPTIYPINYDEGFDIKWTQCEDDDFFSYKLFEYKYLFWEGEYFDEVLLYETYEKQDTSFFKTVKNFRSYQVVVEDIWGLTSENWWFVDGDFEVEIFGETYSVQNTSSLSVDNGQPLTGQRIPNEIGLLTNLRNLILYNNQLVGTIPPEVGNLHNLKNITINGNEITGGIPIELVNLTYLETLNLGGNQLNGEIPSFLVDITSLSNLSLNNNQFTGEIPPEFGQNNGSIGGINLSFNELSGSIPDSLYNIYGINLSYNQLSGNISSEICTNIDRGRLWLHSNYLSGVIPECICDLELEFWDDQKFKIDYNQFCPPYPSCIEDYMGVQDTSSCD